MKTWINNRGLSLKSVITTSAITLSSLMVTTPTYASELELLWQLDNFDQPESVVANPAEKAIYVSNISGQPTELNGKGYISKLSVGGKMLKKHWITNLDAPKGIAVSGDNLYIADMQRVHQVSISKGLIINQFQVEQAKMLNDITIADDGTVYISDLLGGGIYRISDNQISSWFSHENLAHPNGLLWRKNELLVATWGLGMNDDFTTKTAGSIYALNIKNSNLIAIKGAEQLGNLDGLAQKDNTLYVSDWISGDLFKIENDNSSKVHILKPGLADIGISKSILFTPSMHDGKLTAWQL